MLADEPLKGYKTGSNLVRAIDAASNDDMDATRNSISTRLQKNREPNHNNRQIELQTNTRTGLGSSGSGDSTRKRRKRRRMKQLKQRCRHGDSESCEKLRRMIRHETELVAEEELVDGAEVFNRDLVRSLDRRSSKHRRQRRKKNGKKNPESDAEELQRKRDRKTRKQEEREERRRKKKERREKRRLLKQQRRKEMREKRRKLEEETEQNVTPVSSLQKRHTLKERSVTEEPKCQIKLIESCTWPHCNPTCPKLKNPETGKSILNYSQHKHYSDLNPI